MRATSGLDVEEILHTKEQLYRQACQRPRRGRVDNLRDSLENQLVQVVLELLADEAGLYREGGDTRRLGNHPDTNRIDRHLGKRALLLNRRLLRRVRCSERK